MVTIKTQLVPGAPRTYDGTNARAYVTVHQTGNPDPGADAQAHADLQTRGGTGASWHWQVDDRIAIKSYDHTARCWHAGDGDGPGNYSSIAVEVCINSDGDYTAALENAAELVARIADAEDIPTGRIVQHHHWSGKDCPAQLRDARAGVSWSDFLDMVDRARAGGASRDEDRGPTPLAVDGVWGPAVTRSEQTRLDAPYVDGEISRQNEYWEDDNPGLGAGWEWIDRDRAVAGRGSQTITLDQRDLKERGHYRGDVDGLAGPEYFKAKQRDLKADGWYDGAIDGEIWRPSSTVEAMQRKENARRKDANR